MNSTLPDYKQMMSPEVRDRFARLVRRPVIMETRNLFKEFPTSSGKNQIVLKDISFQVHQREFLSIIGPSGCGKSTLIRILAGLETATSGEILLDGKPVVAPGAERGMVFQKYTLFPWLTVCRNVMFGLESIGKDRDTAENIALQWLDIIGLARYADYYPGQLSGGMQQRVAIARALAPQPRVLLMDEPFGALDAQTRTQMQNYLLEVWRNIDITIIFVTHDLDEAVYLSDRILALKANPGEINELIEVPLPRPRRSRMLLEPEFLATREHIDKLIRPPVKREDECEFKVVNMVGDKTFL
ncbi:ABC transporter ATP-binding protein [uncultured Victivallis sp.]|uniref:ABC transporter ATP-binding protein n=1 Tax=uncultured Victivallis sp. TaxID=354118 RepID=UPI0025D6339C|nr:ABC transporter ATP-binding protein [uncultured Victivallis sp.]